MKTMMKKPVALLILGILCVWTISAQTAVELDTAIQQASREISVKLFGGPRVAVISCAAPTDAMSAYVLKEMAVALEKPKTAVIIARNNVDQALAESNAKSTDNIPDASALQIGKKLGAQFVVTGIMEKTGETYRLRTRLISVATNRMEVTTTANIKDSALVRQLIPPPAAAAVPVPAPAPAPAPAPRPAPAPAPAAPAQGLKNGIYTLNPRPRARQSGGTWEEMWISKVEVEDKFITFHFDDRATGSGSGYHGNRQDWYPGDGVTLYNLDNPNASVKASGITDDYRLRSLIFPHLNAKRFRLESTKYGRDKAFDEIILPDEPDRD
jgi:TolB-like protein